MLRSCVLVYSVNDKCACVCVESELLGVFSSSLLCLLFAANMATNTLSLKSPLKAQPPPPPPPPPQPPPPPPPTPPPPPRPTQPPSTPSLNSLRKSELHHSLWELDTYWLTALPSLTVCWKSALHITVKRACLMCEGLCEVWKGLILQWSCCSRALFIRQHEISCPGFEKSAPISNINVSVGSNKVILLLMHEHNEKTALTFLISSCHVKKWFQIILKETVCFSC